jgi:hypothetical protein
MDISKNKENNLSEEYLAACQLLELIGDIERCATMLADAAKKARERCEKNKTLYLSSKANN